MIKLGQGWLRLYLFYGGAFFLLGLAGFLLSNDFIIGYLQKYMVLACARLPQYIQEIKNYSLARDFGLVDEDETIPATAKQFTPFIIYAYPTELEKSHTALTGEILFKMAANFPKAKMVVFPNRRNWESRLLSLLSRYNRGDMRSYENNTILIGFDLLETIRQRCSYKITVILPDFLADTLASQIILSYSELSPDVSFQSRELNHWRMLDCFWEDTGRDRADTAEMGNGSSGFPKAVDLLIQILQQNISGAVKI